MFFYKLDKIFHIIFLLSSIFFCTFFAAVVFAYDLPDLGSSSEAVLSHGEEQKMVTSLLKDLHQGDTILNDAVVTDYIQKLGSRLVAHNGSKKRNFSFFVLNDDSINAFAAPGGNICVFKGLILETESESELAAVMAHEIAHVTQHHIERTIEQTKAVNIPMMAATLAAAAIGVAAKGGDAAAGTAMAAAAGGSQYMVNFTREKESEADSVGIRTLYNAGFDTRAMVDFFARVSRQSFDYGQHPPSFLLTHPVTEARMAAAENKFKLYPPRDCASSDRYYLIKARLKALTRLDAPVFFQAELAEHPGREDMQYAYSVALLKNHQYEPAKTAANMLIKKHPDEILYKMLMAQILQESNNLTSAVDILQVAYQKHSAYYPLIMQYGNALLAKGDARGAAQLLGSQLKTHGTDIELYTLLAQAQANSGDLSSAYHTRASMFKMHGDYRVANFLEEKANENARNH